MTRIFIFEGPPKKWEYSLFRSLINKDISSDPNNKILGGIHLLGSPRYFGVFLISGCENKGERESQLRLLEEFRQFQV